MSGETILDVNSPAAQQRWASIATEARRRRLAVSIVDGTAEHPYRATGKERSGADWTSVPYDTLDQAFRVAEEWVLEHPVPGPVALRDELRDMARKLAVLTPREVSRPRGQDWPLYRRFRDRILPLAFDNLVDSVALETLRDAALEAVTAYDQRGNSKSRSKDLALAMATLRGLVEPASEPEKEST
jgi:hypothetical protein